MRKISLVSVIFLLILNLALSPSTVAQEWEVRKSRGTLKVVDMYWPLVSASLMYADFLIRKDKDGKLVPSLAEDWRWVNDRTIEFKLRKAVTFHNGEELNAEAVKVNWEAYRKMESPNPMHIMNIPDDTVFEIIDKYKVRFTFSEPDALAYQKFWIFDLFAPAFFSEHTFKEGNWSQLEEPGPWGAGPFKLVEGSALYVDPSERIVLEAFEDYWDPHCPKVKRVIFVNSLLGDRKEAMRLCRETEGAVDLVSSIRPLDTLKVAESPFAKVVKSRDVTWLGGIFNLRKENSKWRDIRLRKALNYAINREELFKYAAKGNAFNLGGMIPEGAYGHNPNVTLFTYDTTKARSLLTEAGYPNGFEVRIIAPEAFRVETQIISRMLERIGLKPSFEILTVPELRLKTLVPLLDKPPEEQDWDCYIYATTDWVGYGGGPTFLFFGFLESSGRRWIEYDSVYEEMWDDMIRTADIEVREEKIGHMVQYLYDHAYPLFIYSPLSLYAVNKEVNFVPYKDAFLNLRETSVTDSHWSIRGETE
jgi:peptide/nickel transport system substrate-binding protein